MNASTNGFSANKRVKQLIAIKLFNGINFYNENTTKREQLFISLTFKTWFHLSNKTNKFNQSIHYHSTTQSSKLKRHRHCQLSIAFNSNGPTTLPVNGTQIEQEVKVIWQKAPHGGPFPG